MRIVLVHGLWHGAWCWDAVVADLTARGHDVSAVDLPMRGLDSDVASVQAVLDDRDTLLVGHSYGGAVITAAGTHPSVRQLVYLAAFALTETESVSQVAPDAQIAPTGLGAAMRFSADRAEVSIDPDLAPGLLYHRSPPDVVAAALARLRPVSRSLFSARPEHVAWRDIPSTYVVCTDDRTVAPELQRVMAARATHVLEWDTDHSPAASRPREVADLLAALAGGVTSPG